MVGCGGSDTSAPTAGAELLTVAPAGGSAGVSVTSPVVMTFSGPMQSGMEQYLDLHHGDASGPTVPIDCAWSSDRHTVTCTPSQPLQPHTTYTMHMGGRMMDADGHPVDMQDHQTANGGEWLMPTMMGGMHAGMPMGGMGAGWKGTNGSYGMLFPFTTS
jgi:hypothetical protein